MTRLRKISSKFSLKQAFVTLILILITCNAYSQRIPAREIGSPLTRRADTLPSRLAITSSDTTKIPGDSAKLQKIDSFTLKLSKDSLDAPVQYYAQDSAVILIKNNRVILYGKTKTDYKDVSLTAPRVEIDQKTQTLLAVNAKDSLGIVTEDAKFKQGESDFTSDTIVYNFKTSKGITRNTITNTGELFVHGDRVKKVNNEVTYVLGGFFTTCNLDEPHFGFRSNKIKLINKKLAISGPTHPEFEGVPVPIYLPFGYFPLSQGRHSGFLPPQFAQNDQFGLGLEGLGYYKVLNDYWDAKIYGNIYSYGGWSAYISPTYRKRYHYSGSLNFGLQKTKRNFKGDPDYYTNNSYTLTWNHTADTKARPGTSFSANVNASSTSFNKNIPNSPALNFQDLLTSSISYSKTWVDKPYNLTVTANHSQSNYKHLVSISLPDVGFTMNTIYPFQKKEFVGDKKWYEQLGIGYNGSFRNQVSFYDTAFRLRQLIDTLQWGAQHNVPITLSLPPILGGAVVVSPSISYSQVWIAQRLRMRWNPVTKKIDSTVTKGFNIDQQVSMGVGLNTALYGTFNFKKSSRIQAIRHVVRPTLGFSYKPDLSKKYFYTTQVDTTGYTQRYSELTGSMFSGYGEGRAGGLTFQVDNNLEMKVRSKKDTTGGEAESVKIRLIDGYGFSTSYNFLADSMKLSPLQFYFRTNLLEKINLNASATMSPYQVDSRGRDIDKYAWQGGKFRPGRITSGNISLSTSFKSKPRDDKEDQQKKQQMDQQLNDPTLAADRQRLLDYMRQNPAEFVDFNIPWQVNISYSLYFAEQFDLTTVRFKREVRSSANFNGSFSLTPKWNFTVNGFYDLDTKKLQTFTMSIAREMHCWQMSINVTPIGLYRFFNFSISPKSGMLQDLRVNRSRSFYTP